MNVRINEKETRIIKGITIRRQGDFGRNYERSLRAHSNFDPERNTVGKEKER